MNKVFCRLPFFNCEIFSDGNVYVCCNQWCSYYSIGNILNDDLYEIFYGEKINEFISQFIKQDFKYCKINTCIGCEILDDDKSTESFNTYSTCKKKL